MAIKRHTPLRTCVACGIKTSKSELTRLVATPQGGVEIDATGRQPGRGAYVHTSGECVGELLKRSRLEYALRRRVTETDWQRVTSSLKTVTAQS